MTPIPFSGFSDPISSWTHLLAALAATVGAVLLFSRGRGNTARLVSLFIFSFALVFLFSMSGIFHLLERGGEARDVLQRLDHAGIWVLIAGTFTPIQVILFRGPWRWGMLLLIWSLAITGLVLEVVFFTSFPEWLLLSFFLGLGWLGAISVVQFAKVFKGASIRLIVAGGIFYSVGAVIDFMGAPNLLRGVFGPHELFHVFVILGALSHWLFIYEWCHHPIGNTITFEVLIFPDGKVTAQAIGERLKLDADSVANLKSIVMGRVIEKFHSSIRPMVRLRYLKEEHLWPANSSAD